MKTSIVKITNLWLKSSCKVHIVTEARIFNVSRQKDLLKLIECLHFGVQVKKVGGKMWEWAIKYF